MLTFDKIMTPSQFAREMLEQNKQGIQYNPKTLQEHMNLMQGKNYRNETEFLFESKDKIRKNKFKLINFSEMLYENLLEECLCTVFDRIMEAEKATQHEMAIGHSMISKLIKEEGVSNLLMKFETKNLLLSEFSRFAQNYHKAIMEAS
jgi:hypothetical protein